MTVANQNQEQPLNPPLKSRVDDILVGIATANQELINPKPKVENSPVEAEKEPVKDKKALEGKKESTFEADKQAYLEAKKAPKPPANTPIPKEPDAMPAAASGEEKLNDYGLPEAPPVEKMYPESEVNKMIRERLDRMKQTATPEQVKQISADMKETPQTSEDWEVELNAAIDRRVDSREKIQNQQNEERKELQRQAAFENKFNEGMKKYPDYWKTVNDVGEISPTIFVSIRGMDTPAEFLYAAAKLQPKELQRITKIEDPATMIMEMGRLDERMRKAAVITNAPRPLDRYKGDYHNEDAPKKKEKSIDERVLEDEQRKLNRMQGRR